MASGEHFLLGAVAGFEVGPRVGLALLGAEMLSRGWHSGTVFGTFAAAVAVGVLLQLNASQFEDALGIAGTQSSGLTGARFGAMCKRMQHGFAARNGLQAAFLAAAGYTGIKKVFELQHGGFLSVFGEANSPDLSLISAGLGERWEIEQIIAKTYAVMGGIHAPLDALFEIASKRKLSPDLIDHIEVDLPEAAYRHGVGDRSGPFRL
jgi:2-methylcitrate dehydratase PrpD